MSKKDHHRRRARPPGSTKPTARSMETAEWKSTWDALKARPLDPYERPSAYVDGKCEGFRYLHTIYSHTNIQLLAEAIDYLGAAKTISHLR